MRSKSVCSIAAALGVRLLPSSSAISPNLQDVEHDFGAFGRGRVDPHPARQDPVKAITRVAFPEDHPMRLEPRDRRELDQLVECPLRHGRDEKMLGKQLAPYFRRIGADHLARPRLFGYKHWRSDLSTISRDLAGPMPPGIWTDIGGLTLRLGEFELWTSSVEPVGDPDD